MSGQSVAVAIACFNRRETTLRCLRALASQRGDLDISVYLADDGSVDGTADAVRRECPDVVILRGNGSWYWTGGTNAALKRAAEGRPDYFLWLNDDVTLEPDAIELLVRTANERPDTPAIAAGAVVDPIHGGVAYGGKLRGKHALDLRDVDPNGTVQEVDTMNGNVVLVPTAIQSAIGLPDGHMRHNMADLDYGFRARREGFSVLLAERPVGYCPSNAAKSVWTDPSRPLTERWHSLTSPKGLPPRAWFRFTSRHCGWRWPLLFASTYARALMPSRRRKRRAHP